MLVTYLNLLDDPEEQRKFERVYTEYRQMMFYVANDVLHNEYDAEDAVQQAFMRVMNHLDGVDENDKHKTKSFLSIIAQNVAIDIYRKKRRDWEYSTSYDAHEIYIEDPKGQDFENIKEEDHRLADAIAKLPKHYADVIRLTYIHGFGSEKIGALLDLTPENVRQRLVRARRKLAKILGGKYEDYI